MSPDLPPPMHACRRACLCALLAARLPPPLPPRKCPRPCPPATSRPCEQAEAGMLAGLRACWAKGTARDGGGQHALAQRMHLYRVRLLGMRHGAEGAVRNV